jgi:bifunctional non-homologous end joining protein LigD
MQRMKRPLDRYAEKRTFTKTPEPAPSVLTARTGPLLFVVQKHFASHLPYDLRLEVDGVLKSWAVPKGVSFDPTERRLAVETEDHPFEYASFEGVIPAKQYGAGNVIVWDCGVYSPDEDKDYDFEDREAAQARMRDGLAKGKLSFLLRGEKLKGSFALVRTSTDKQWLLIKHKDRYVSAEDANARHRSVLSGIAVDDLTQENTMARIAAERLTPTGRAESLPAKLSPMLAEAADAPFTDERWLYEPKLDGYRTIAYIDGDTVKLISRGGIDVTIAYPEIVKDLQQQAIGTMVLDGEIVAYGKDGKPSFGALQ